MYEDGYQALADAIIRQACDDYVMISEENYLRNCLQRKRLEDFFRGGAFTLYSDLDPEYLISELKVKRIWNWQARKRILRRYGSFKAFGAEMLPNKPWKVVNGFAKYYLKSSVYPPIAYLEKWNKALGITPKLMEKWRNI